MFQSLIKNYGGGYINICRLAKHYKDGYGGVVVLKGSLMFELCMALRNPSSDYKWILEKSAKVNYHGKMYSTKVYKLMAEKIKQESIKFRAGDYDQIRLYFKEFDELDAFVKWFNGLKEKDIVTVEGLQGVDENALIGHVTVSSELKDYKLKVITKTLDPSTTDYKRLRQTLNQFSDDIRVTGRLKEMLYDPSYKYFLWESYFYCKDESAITYISLSFPELIKKIYQLHHRD